MTTWLPVVGYEGRYEVSDDGRVMSCAHHYMDVVGRVVHKLPRVLSPGTTKGGHQYVSLTVNGKTSTYAVHILVLCAFIGSPPIGMECRHLDNDPANNRVDNLKWGTRTQNQQDSMLAGTHSSLRRGEQANRTVLSDTQVAEMKLCFLAGYTTAILGIMFGVSRTRAWQICVRNER